MAGNALLDYFTPETKLDKLAESSSGAPDQFNINWLRNTGTPDIRVGEPDVSIGKPPVAPVNETAGASPTPTNLLTASSAAPVVPGAEAPPKDAFQQYWGQPVGKTHLPLDQFVRLAGMAAHAINPRESAGILGKDLAEMGKEAYGERARREYETPNMLLKRRLTEAQIKQAEQKDVPTEWAAYLKYGDEQGWPREKTVANFKKLSRTEKETDILRSVPNPNFDPKKPISFENPKLVKRAFSRSGSQLVHNEAVPDEPVIDPFAKAGDVDKYKEEDLKIKRAREKRESAKEARIARQTAGGKKIKWHEANAAGKIVHTFADGSMKVINEDTGEFEEAKASDLVGLTRMPTPGKNKKSFVEELKDMRAKKAGGAAPGAGGKFTESQLRSQLTEKKKADPTVDVEKAMKYYKSIGKY